MTTSGIVTIGLAFVLGCAVSAGNLRVGLSAATLTALGLHFLHLYRQN